MKAGETMTLETSTSVAGNGYATKNIPVSQVFVFKDETLLGWDCFYKHSIRVGSRPESDIVLDDPSIAGRHAVFYVKGNKIVVSARAHELDLRVNDKRSTSSILTPLDYVGIGPYTLKVKIPGMTYPGLLEKEGPELTQLLSVKPKLINNGKNRHGQKRPTRSTPATLKYRVIFKGELINGFDSDTVRANLCALLHSDKNTVNAYIEKQKPLVTLADSLTAAKNQYIAFKKAGARCTIETVASDADHPPARGENPGRLPAPETGKSENDIDVI